MRLFKATYRDRGGVLRRTAKWYVEFRDQREQYQRVPAFSNRAASEELGRRLEALVAY